MQRPPFIILGALALIAIAVVAGLNHMQWLAKIALAGLILLLCLIGLMALVGLRDRD